MNPPVRFQMNPDPDRCLHHRHTANIVTGPKPAPHRRRHYLRDRVHAGGDEINGETTIAKLWTAYRKYLVEVKKRATNTLPRYDRVAKAIVKALGSLRLREATTQRFERFLQESAKYSGADAKGARTVRTGMCGIAVRYDV
jgi:hypothetical protein